MAEAIIAPYVQSSSEISTLKSETYTLENFVMKSSFSGSNAYNYTSYSYSSSGGAGVMPLYYSHTSVSHTRPDEWTQSFVPILCSSLCDVERCVIRISAKYTSGTGLATSSSSLTTYIGIGWLETPDESSMDDGLFLSANTKGYWSYGWPVTILNGSVNSTDDSIAEYDLVSSTNCIGQAQSYWRSRNPNNIQLVLVSTNNGSNSTYTNPWSASSGSLSLTVNATCTIIYTDYR